ncbi:STAS domain-containing protein [Domibacillus sp. DTU_2020_1001157_1_SI_ALB_TIR_016]|uniref:STAS domain-containing protein n=1 Tax=Domibacillus sp. DTU_2020_1001157_1_SI_ALB_TIR_016 TaxID=3077789 RepID=UPI0028EC8FED|nr:STAS domain-containing protein [Domibacillus sp. DTU_2020_1001157_1_SI_ALB_TIR_016]WNS77787.1 STAS domain-containing protein [Domibacillus sp. DTU_2020_1001157_1_SI_ALB_TIR_016]
MEEKFQPSFKLQAFFEINNQKFEEKLLEEAVNVKNKIDEILSIGNINLVNNAHKLVVYILDGKVEELELFAKQEGIAWATHSIDLSFKLEWVQAIRRTIWNFIEQYNDLTDEQVTSNFFRLEKEINNQVDAFLNAFFISYSTYKDSLIRAHRKLVENLSVPIIPINNSVCILPVIGSVDMFRTSILEEKVLTEIGVSRIQTLIMDLSGIADMEPQVIDHLTKIIDGTSLMGCNTVITGLRAEVVRKMIHMGRSFDPGTKTLGTLQQALKEYLIS